MKSLLVRKRYQVNQGLFNQTPRYYWLHSPWMMWAVSIFFVLFQFSLQLSTGVITKQLMYTFSLTAFETGLISAAYFVSYLNLQIPAGMMIDRIDPRRLLSYGGLIYALGYALLRKVNLTQCLRCDGQKSAGLLWKILYYQAYSSVGCRL